MIRIYLLSPRAELPPSSYPGAMIQPLGKSALGYGYIIEFPGERAGEVAVKLGKRLLRVRSEAGELRAYYVPRTTIAVVRSRDYGGKWKPWTVYGAFGSFLHAQRAMVQAFGRPAR